MPISLAGRGYKWEGGDENEDEMKETKEEGKYYIADDDGVIHFG